MEILSLEVIAEIRKPKTDKLYHTEIKTLLSFQNEKEHGLQ